MSADDSFKVREAERTAASSRERPREDFREVLRRAPSPPAPKRTGPPLRAPPLTGKAPGLTPPGLQRTVGAPQVTAASLASAPASVERLGEARAGMHVDASRLQTVRQDGLVQGEHRSQVRVLELIAKDLAAEFSAEGARAGPSAEPRAGPATSEGSPGGARVGQAGGADSGGGGRSGDGSAAKVESGAANGEARAQAAVALVERIELFVKSQRPALALTVGGGIDARVEVERTGPNEVALRLTGRKGPPSPEDVARIGEELRARGLKVSRLAVG